MQTTHLRTLIAASMLVLSGAAQADQTLGRTGYPEERPGFFHRASDSIGGFFRRLFGNDDEEKKQSQQSQPRYGSQQRSQGPQRYNLDQPPTGARYTPPQKNTTRTTAQQSRKPAPADNSDQTPRQKPKSKNTVGDSIAQKSERPAPQPKLETKPEPKPLPQRTVAENKPSGPSANSEKTTSTSESSPAPKSGQDQTVLTGSKTSKSGRVKSPYPPNNELDVSGLPSGSLALDPTTQKIFRVP